MTDYGHDLLFGTFVTPSAQGADHALELAVAADRSGLDFVTFQDHPYQPAYLDTWTLMAYAAARTERVRFSGNVLSLPLRPPAVLARAAASLDILSGGRVELGLGAGAFWDAIAAMGARRLTAGESVDALREAVTIIRDLWDTEPRGGVRFDGDHYQVSGAKRGPKPAHDMEIWIGSYGPRMLALTGAVGDGWVPSYEYLKEGADSLPAMNASIDAAATAAGRSPSDVRRLLNIMNVDFSDSGRGLLAGPPEQWTEALTGLVLDHGITGFFIGGDDLAITERFATDVAPAVRQEVARARNGT